MVSKVKWVAALAATSVMMGAIATDANAQRRERGNQQRQGGGQSVSREFSAAYAPANAAVTASDWATADAALPALKAAAKSPYETFIASFLDLRIALGTNNAARQLTAINAAIDSGGMPADDSVRLLTAGTQLAYQANQYDLAATRGRAAVAAGADVNQLAPLIMAALTHANKTNDALAFLAERETAAQASGGHAAESLYSAAAQALREGNRNAELMDVLAKRANFYPTAFNIRTAGLIILEQAPNDRALSIDVLRLLRDSGSMDDRRYYIELVQNLADAALPNEVLTSIAGGRAANVIPANDTTFREFETAQRDKLAEDRASLAAGERAARAAPDGRRARLIADAYYSYGDNAKAIDLFQVALQKTPADADLLNTRIGIAQMAAGNFPAAITAFNAVQAGPRKATAQLWTAYAQARVNGTPARLPAQSPAPAPAAAPAATPAAQPAR